MVQFGSPAEAGESPRLNKALARLEVLANPKRVLADACKRAVIGSGGICGLAGRERVAHERLVDAEAATQARSIESVCGVRCMAGAAKA